MATISGCRMTVVCMSGSGKFKEIKGWNQISELKGPAGVKIMQGSRGLQPSSDDQPGVPGPHVPAICYERALHGRTQHTDTIDRMGSLASNDFQWFIWWRSIIKDKEYNQNIISDKNKIEPKCLQTEAPSSYNISFTTWMASATVVPCRSMVVEVSESTLWSTLC